MQARCALLSGFFVLALLLARPGTVCGAAAVEPAAAAPREPDALVEGGCSRASLAALNDIVGSVSEDSFRPNPSIGGGGGTDAPGCGRPNHTRRQDPGNPVGPVGRPTSSFTIIGVFP